MYRCVRFSIIFENETPARQPFSCRQGEGKKYFFQNSNFFKIQSKKRRPPRSAGARPAPALPVRRRTAQRARHSRRAGRSPPTSRSAPAPPGQQTRVFAVIGSPARASTRHFATFGGEPAECYAALARPLPPGTSRRGEGARVAKRAVMRFPRCSFSPLPSPPMGGGRSGR